jgi:hypothetical protein
MRRRKGDACCRAGSAQAQTAADAAQLEEIVIAAARRESDVQKTATSVLLFIIRGYRL